MSGGAWKADPVDLDEALQQFVAAAVEGELDYPPHGLDLLEAAGRLAALDAGAEVASWGGRYADRARQACRALEDPSAFEDLEDAGVTLRAALDRRARGEGDVPAGEIEPDLRRALGVRDRIELAIVGAEALLGHAPALSPDQESALLVFESLVRPDLFRLTAANEARRAAAAWMSPARRPSFWWWHEGADVAPHAVASLPAVAHLCARFPAAAEALRALVDAQRAWDDAGKAARSAQVVSFGAWLGQRIAEARGGSGQGLALAAATAGEEITLVDRPDLQVSWCPPDALLIDLVADRAAGATPTLRLAAGATVASEPVAGAEERFRIAAPPRLLAETRAVLVLPLAGGTVEIPLPPDPQP